MSRLTADVGTRVVWAALLGVMIVTCVVAFDLAGSVAEAARGYICGNSACTIVMPISG